MLGAVSDLELVARTVVNGFLHGMHRSRHLGQSVDFAQHRLYQPGDDLRRIDWKAYARTDRLYLKTFEADTNASVTLCVDVSASMGYGSRGLTKLRYAQMLAASLAWLAQRQGDRVGLIHLRDGMVDMVPPSTRHLQLILHTLGRARAEGTGVLPQALHRVADVPGRPGMLVVITDCYEAPETLAAALGALRARGHDLMVFHLLDPAERDLPFDAPGTFEDLETGHRLALQPEELRERYRELIVEHQEVLRRLLTNQGADYVVLETDQPLAIGLRTWLDRRLMASAVA